MRRKPGTLLPLELSILEAAVDLRRRGVPEYHGYLIAKEISEKKERSPSYSPWDPLQSAEENGEG